MADSPTWYRCPACGARVGAIGTPTTPVVCSGWKLDPEAEGGKRRVHSTKVCVVETGVDGETKPQPNPNRKTPTMPKEASNLCACYSETDAQGNHVSCGRLVKGRFAPGHDAKLKGNLIRAAVAGESYKTKDPDGKPVNRDVVAFAKELGWADLINKGVAVAQARADRPKRVAKAAGTNRVAPKAKVDRSELIARAAAKKAQKDGAPKATPRKAANAKKAAANKAGALV